MQHPSIEFLQEHEQLFHSLIDSFCARRIDAKEFLKLFFQSWRGRSTMVHDVLAGAEIAKSKSSADSFCHDLREIDVICEAYLAGLPAGGAYRVSEEQFRTEIRGLLLQEEKARVMPLARAERSVVKRTSRMAGH